MAKYRKNYKRKPAATCAEADFLIWESLRKMNSVNLSYGSDLCQSDLFSALEPDGSRKCSACKQQHQRPEGSVCAVAGVVGAVMF